MEAQIGLRWLVEALAGGNLEGLTTNSFLTYVQGREAEVAQQLSNLKAVLKTKRTVLVGHNVFIDLIYLYRCFFGQLPEHVEDFQDVMHKLFLSSSIPSTWLPETMLILTRLCPHLKS